MRFVRLVLLAGVCSAAALSAQQGQVPGAFRSRITLVPLDVRVLDRDGKPVTDLKQEDFTVLEDGVPQRLGHFSFDPLRADPAGAAEGLELRQPPGSTLKAQERRVFLIVLGRGQLQAPAKGIDAALDFVRRSLLPQDVVAVQAFNRATAFTTNHEAIAGVLERYRKAHVSIDNRLSNRAVNVARASASALPASVRRDIDAIFDAPGAASRALAPGTLANDGRILDAMRDANDRLLLQTLVRTAPSDPEVAVRPDQILAHESAFSAFMTSADRALSDLNTIFMAIEYMRFLEGEKHLIFMSEYGLLLPSLEDDKSVAAMAADARVAIDTIRTGGVQDVPASSMPVLPPGSSQAMLRSTHDAALMGSSVRGSRAEPIFTAGTMKLFARLTGGHASLYSYAREAFARIDAGTRASYLLGYYPSRPDGAGRFRQVRVRVNRPGVTVQHRFGYYDRAQLVPFDKRAFMAYARIAAAGAERRQALDIEVTLKASVVKSAQGLQVAAEGTIDISKLSLVPQDGRRVGVIDLAIFCGAANEDLVGERWDKIELKLTEESYQKALKSGFNYSALVPVTAMPRHVKVIVYDHAVDLVGSASASFSR